MTNTRRGADSHDGDFYPPRRRRWRWAAFVCLLLLIMVGAGYFTWSKRAEQQLAEYLAELRAQGEPTEPADLIHPPIPAEDDAAIDLLAAAALVDAEGEALKAFLNISFDGPLSTEERATIARVVEGERDALDRVRASRGKRGADWRIPYQSPSVMTLLPHLNTQRVLAHVSHAAALHEQLRGDHAAAVEHLRDVLAMGESLDTQPVLVGHLVAIGIRAMATHRFGELAPELAIRAGPADGGGIEERAGEKAATVEQVRGAIRELLDEARAEAGIRNALRGERVMQTDTARLLADRKLDFNTVSGVVPGGGGVFGWPPMPRGLVLTDALLMAQRTSDLLNTFEKSPDFPTFNANLPPVPAAIRTKSIFHAAAALLMPSYDRFALQHYRGMTDRRLAAVVLALRLYAADHDGIYPPALDDLVPQYLVAIPNDPFAAGGKPLLYDAADPAAPAVYSVADNGKDDGGSEGPSDPRRPGTNRWQTLDAVMRMKATRLVETEAEAEARKAKPNAE